MKELYLLNKIWTTVTFTVASFVLSLAAFGWNYWFVAFSFSMLGFVLGAIVWDYEDNTK